MFHSQWFNFSFQIGRPTEIHPCTQTNVFQVQDNQGVYCYHISNQILERNEAKSACEALDPRAHLVRINDEEDKGFIQGVYNKSYSLGISLVVWNKICLRKLAMKMNFRGWNTNI